MTSHLLPLNDLRKGQEKKVDLHISQEEFNLVDKEIELEGTLSVQGRIYLVDDHIIFHFSVDSNFRVPCKICNETFIHPLCLKELYHTEEIPPDRWEDYNLLPPIREAVLIELPDVFECSGGACPKRKELAKYFSKERKQDENSSIGYHPFSSL